MWFLINHIYLKCVNNDFIMLWGVILSPVWSTFYQPKFYCKIDAFNIDLIVMTVRAEAIYNTTIILNIPK